MEEAEYKGKERLKGFLEIHKGQFPHPEAVLCFGIRHGDPRTTIKNDARAFIQGVLGKIRDEERCQIRIIGEHLSIQDDQLTEIATQAILNRARRIFSAGKKHEADIIWWIEHEKIELFTWSAEVKRKVKPYLDHHYEKLKVRPGDRLLQTFDRVPLEQALAEIAQEIGVPYYCIGKRTEKCTLRHENEELNFAAEKLNEDPRYLPLPLAEALYIGRDYELKNVFDWQTDQPEILFQDDRCKPGDVLLVCAYRKEKDKYEWSELCVVEVNNLLSPPSETPWMRGSAPINIRKFPSHQLEREQFMEWCKKRQGVKPQCEFRVERKGRWSDKKLFGMYRNPFFPMDYAWIGTKDHQLFQQATPPEEEVVLKIYKARPKGQNLPKQPMGIFR